MSVRKRQTPSASVDVQLPGEIAGRQLRGKEGEIDVLQLQLGLRQRLGLPWGDGGVQACG